MRSSSVPFCLAALLAGTATASAVRAQADRREVFEPGLTVETGARTGACDLLLFTPGGRHLLACGDDKVVRVWPCSPQGLDPVNARVLRWGTYREQRGNIYAMALSPDPQGRYVAVAGHGLRDGSLAVLDRISGQVVAGLTGKTTPNGVPPTVWAIAFSPSGDLVAAGGQDGSVWLWDWRATPPRPPRLLGRHNGDGLIDHVRLVEFAGESSLVSVAGTGQGVRWQWDAEKASGKEVLQFERPEVADRLPALKQVVASPDPKRRWLAAALETDAVVLQARDGRARHLIRLPREPLHVPQCLTFDAKGERLAVGSRVTRRPAGDPRAPLEQSDGDVLIYDLTGDAPQRVGAIRTAYLPQALAFHPDGRLAIADSDHFEVKLWRIGDPPKLQSTIRGPGRSLWGVALSADGRYLGYRDQREPDPESTNRRGRGPWKVFDLERRTWTAAAGFRPLPLRESAAGWTVQPSPTNLLVWYAIDPKGKKHRLPLTPRDHMPRCYAFLKPAGGKVRLLVGHYWGASLFELDPAKGPRRVRLFSGHQGEVTSLVVSENERWMVTASRDQTVAGWSLTDWPSQAELGARFVIREGKLWADQVDPGSPAWEAGLTAGDQVTRLAYQLKEVKGGPEQWLDVLRAPAGGVECYLEVARPEATGSVKMLTSIRQRPTWVFFPMQDGEWVLWRWRDYYYATSTKGDYAIGWQISRDVDRTPEFYPAERFRKLYHQPEKVAEAIRLGRDARLDPGTLVGAAPAVEARAEVPDAGPVHVALQATARSERENQNLARAILWVNDYKFQEWGPQAPELQAGKGRSLGLKVDVPREKLRAGKNVLTFQCYSRAGGRGEAQAQATIARPTPRPRLFGLMIGVSKYGAATRSPDGARLLRDLAAAADAEALQKAWRAQEGKRFAKADVRVLLDKNVTREAILAQLKEFAGTVDPDDQFVLSLGGHGLEADELRKAAASFGLNVKEALPKTAFWFCCHNFDVTQPSKAGLTTKELYAAVAALPCRKLILLDTCHSGSVVAAPVRDLTDDGVGPFILAACGPGESALEDLTVGTARAEGLFTKAILMALDEDFERADASPHNGQLEAEELVQYVRLKVGEFMTEINAGGKTKEVQTPVDFLPPSEWRLPWARK